MVVAAVLAIQTAERPVKRDNCRVRVAAAAVLSTLLNLQGATVQLERFLFSGIFRSFHGIALCALKKV
jgi:hypothetical protein